tara:strand:+ start:5413 stop:6576 length:1164 start_codon:yes stop_codon:yes gene_type:complete
MLRPTLFTLLASLSIATIAEAQRPVYRPAVAQEKRWTTRFNASALFGVSMKLKNLGSVRFTGSELNPDDGSTTYFYNDGFITVPAGQTTTTEFVFSWDEQTGNLVSSVDPFGRKSGQSLDEFTLNRYSAVSLGAELELEESANTGWEIAYKYEFGHAKKRIRFGIVAGLGIYNLDFDAITTVNSELRIDSQNFGVSQPIDLGAALPFNSSSSLGPVRVDVGMLANTYESATGQTYSYIDPTTGNPVVAEVPVDVEFEYNGAVAMARLGPSVSVRLIDELYFELSGGVALAYLDARVSETKTINDGLPIEFRQFADFSQTTSVKENETLIGYYIEGLLRYQLTPSVGFHASMIQLGFGDLDPVTIEDSIYELDISSPAIGSAGVSIIF